MAGTPQRFRYDASKPVEDQLQTFLAGRNPYGTVGNSDWQNVRNPQYYSSHQSDPDESGTTNTVYDSINPDVQLHSGADSPYTLYNGQFAPINWRPTDNPNGIRETNSTTGYVKPDNMYDYNNLYYDDKYGLVRDTRDTRDPNARQNMWIDTALMSAVGGVGGWAAGLANAAAGGASVAGMGAPSLARMAISGVQAADNASNPGDRPTGGASATAQRNYGGSNMAVNPFGTNTSSFNQGQSSYNNNPLDLSQDPNTLGNSPGGNVGGNTGDSSFMNWALGQLGLGGNPGGLNLGSLGSSVLGQYAQNQNNQGYKEDFNNMINVGTGGVTNGDRAGARDLVRGIYDGSISGDQIFDRVPGLRAMSDRGAEDIGRQMSAHGDADPQSSARMREFVKFNNDLTSKAYGSEMDRAAKIGGYDINPSTVAGKGMDALGSIYGNNRNDILSLAALANRGGQQGGSSGSNGGPLSGIASGSAAAAAAARRLGLDPTDPRVLRLLNPNFSGTYTGQEGSDYDPFGSNTEDYGNNPYPGDPNAYMGSYGDTFNPDTFDPQYFGLDIYG